MEMRAIIELLDGGEVIIQLLDCEESHHIAAGWKKRPIYNQCLESRAIIQLLDGEEGHYISAGLRGEPSYSCWMERRAIIQLLVGE